MISIYIYKEMDSLFWCIWEYLSKVQLKETILNLGRQTIIRLISARLTLIGGPLRFIF
jgi:hypothetical protein